MNTQEREDFLMRARATAADLNNMMVMATRNEHIPSTYETYSALFYKKLPAAEKIIEEYELALKVDPGLDLSDFEKWINMINHAKDVMPEEPEFLPEPLYGSDMNQDQIDALAQRALTAARELEDAIRSINEDNGQFNVAEKAAAVYDMNYTLYLVENSGVFNSKEIDNTLFMRAKEYASNQAGRILNHSGTYVRSYTDISIRAENIVSALEGAVKQFLSSSLNTENRAQAQDHLDAVLIEINEIKEELDAELNGPQFKTNEEISWLRASSDLVNNTIQATLNTLGPDYNQPFFVSNNGPVRMDLNLPPDDIPSNSLNDLLAQVANLSSVFMDTLNRLTSPHASPESRSQEKAAMKTIMFDVFELRKQVNTEINNPLWTQEEQVKLESACDELDGVVRTARKSKDISTEYVAASKQSDALDALIARATIITASLQEEIKAFNPAAKGALTNTLIDAMKIESEFNNVSANGSRMEAINAASAALDEVLRSAHSKSAPLEMKHAFFKARTIDTARLNSSESKPTLSSIPDSSNIVNQEGPAKPGL